MQIFWQDLRYGARMLAKAPGLTLIVVLILALGIGANTVIFSSVYAVLLRPLAFYQPERLVLVKESLPQLGWNMLSTAPAEYLDYREGNRVFSEIAAFTPIRLNLTGRGESQRVEIARVSYTVTQRIPEIGLRMALGARPVNILQLITGQGLRLVLLGMAIGLAVSLVFAHFLQKLLFGVSARDPLTFAAITGLLICVALLACWIPARRAMKADPMAALKSE